LERAEAKDSFILISGFEALNESVFSGTKTKLFQMAGSESKSKSSKSKELL
jgi:hypothetical protein